ncbi:MAG TPA: nucleoside 2-deoxyribosyltransferase [Methanosarcinales archaeon]|nr:nucleoside 2-deoxyribosyltransferase [Methanosarcinales archaeon]
MNYLKGKSVYLAGPISDVSDDGVGWREMITPRMAKFGLHVEDPTKKTINGIGEVKDDKDYFRKLAMEHKFDELKEAFWPIVRKDLRCVDKADFIIAVYDPHAKMCGTIDELRIAKSQKKPILMYCNPDKIDKSFNPWILTFPKKGNFYTSWDAILAKLDEVDTGIFDYDHWTI